ncbi:hypothetical protein IF2G_00385 [Cordyceps javanica]|nr:hypothetical protein IF2G_00385 [Cordyceps javanica]
MRISINRVRRVDLRCPEGGPPCGRTGPCRESSATYVQDIGLDARNARGEEKSTDSSGTAEKGQTESTGQQVSLIHLSRRPRRFAKCSRLIQRQPESKIQHPSSRRCQPIP